jgi:hypothetical protein
MLKLLLILLARQPRLHFRNVDSQPISNSRGANTVHVKFGDQLNLLTPRQSALAGIS